MPALGPAAPGEGAAMNRFRFDDRSRAAITAAGTDVPTVLAALRGGQPKIRRHVGNSGLHIYTSTPDGQWLAMRFVETENDDEWLLNRCRVSAVRPV
jgi:hypothetical protein